MRKSIILATVLIAALVAVPAFASVQNVKISGSIDSTWLSRNSFDLGADLTPAAAQIENQSQGLFFTQTILQVDADLTDQVSTTIGLINERVWNSGVLATSGETINQATNVDLYLAYVTLREMLYSPLTVVVGRQVFSYGNSFIVDATGANNAANADSGLAGVAADFTLQTSLDAVRFILDYNPLTVELLYSKLDENVAIRGNDNLTDDQDLYGINATYELGDDMDTQVEAYLFARINQATNAGIVTGTAGATKSDTLYVPGLRASANVLDGLNIQGEIAWQRGNNVSSTTTEIDNEQREAFAAQFISNYQVPASILPDVLETYNPVLGYTFTYVSGDSNPGNLGQGGAGAGGAQASANKDTAWDPLLEAQGGGTIYNTLFNLTNLQIHSVSLTANPIEDVTASVSWHGLWLDKNIDQVAGTGTFTLVSVDGSTPSAPLVNNDKLGVGYEIDIDATYDYTEDVQIGASLGWFVPGDLFLPVNDNVASQALVHGNVNF